jgi:hypothetical protein
MLRDSRWEAAEAAAAKAAASGAANAPEQDHGDADRPLSYAINKDTHCERILCDKYVVKSGLLLVVYNCMCSHSYLAIYLEGAVLPISPWQHLPGLFTISIGQCHRQVALLT